MFGTVLSASNGNLCACTLSHVVYNLRCVEPEADARVRLLSDAVSHARRLTSRIPGAATVPALSVITMYAAGVL